jgi:hypothetical protein
MRLAKKSRTLLPLALSAVLATCAMAQDHPNVQPNAVRDTLKQVSIGGSTPQAGTQMPPASPTKTPGPAGAGAKSPAKVPAPVSKPAPGKDPAKGAVEASPKNAADGQGGVKPPEEKAVSRRDPFDTLLSKARPGNEPPENLPPGKAGLMVETLRINGIVNSPTGMIAVVSNSQQRVYFLRDGDKLYDGSVQKISLEGITFTETGKDAFGKPLERSVTKNLYQISGEKQ